MPSEKNTSLPLPNLDLPFFSYGIFKRDFICHFRIEEFINKYLPNYQISGELRVRDGLPILKSTNKNRTVFGDLIYFKSSLSKEAYQSINDIEPNRQYKWKEMNIKHYNQEIIKANVLDGVKPDRGSSDYFLDSWERGDSLFSDGMYYIEEKINRGGREDYGWENPMIYYEYQASYLLLWSIIERYASLRYYLKSRDAMDKVKKFSEEKNFTDAISKIDKKQFREVFNASDPKKKIVFDASDPERTIKYFYQIRSNITHRGKGVPKDDYFLVKNALEHLHSIFAKILDGNRLR